MQEKYIIKGGKAIGSGGYGCVFHPALRCSVEKNTPTEPDKYVSKLMTNTHAKEEYKIINDINKQLHKIKNHEDYFLTSDVRKCKVKKLSKADKKHFTKKCKPLIKKNITYRNVNKNLSKVSSITMPHGGTDVNDYIYSSINNYQKMNGLFQSLSTLTKNGIIPMNQYNIYHGDIKASNLMIKNDMVKVIDWGLAFSRSKSNVYHKISSGRPFQFNIPFSCVLINHEFQKEYREYIFKNPSPSKSIIQNFVTEFVDRWNNYRGTGSLDLLHYIYGGLIERNANKTLLKHKVHPVIIKYLVNIVEKYTTKNEFHFQKYYNEVYLHNLDLWGIVTSTISVFDLLVANMKILNSIEKNVLDIVDDLFHHILECDNNKISGQKIIDSFQKIAELYNVRQPEPLRTTDSTKTTTHTASSRRKLTSRKVSSKTLRQSLTTYKSITYKDKTRKKYF